MSYKLYLDGNEYTFKNKDDLIYTLAILIGGDGSVPIKIVYPKGWVLIE